jgi:hypothetical protein
MDTLTPMILFARQQRAGRRITFAHPRRARLAALFVIAPKLAENG